MGLGINFFAIIAQLYAAIMPVEGNPSVYNFFMNMLGLPIILGLVVGWKLWNKTLFVRGRNADLITGRRDLNAVEMERQRAERAIWSRPRRYSHILILTDAKSIYFFLC